MLPRLSVAFLLLGALCAVGPLAYASPPDPTWIGGVYDAADYDDAVVAIAAMEAAPEHGPPAVLRPSRIMLGFIPLATGAATPMPLPAASIRAPPVF